MESMVVFYSVYTDGPGTSGILSHGLEGGSKLGKSCGGRLFENRGDRVSEWR